MVEPLSHYGVDTASRDPATGKDKVAKGYKRETFIDAWMRYLPLPATCDEKGREIQGNREYGKAAEG